MSTHNSRMRDLGRIAGPPMGSTARELLEKAAARGAQNRKVRKAAKALWDRARALLVALHQNGAGFELDQTLREFCRECAHRIAHWGLHSLPASFNVLEAYLSYVFPLVTFELRQERDHLCSFDHFLEWVTEPSFVVPVEEAVDHFVPGEIYSYTNMDPLGSTQFSSFGARSFVVSGFSITRHASELTVLLLAGEKCDLEAKTEELQGRKIAPAPGRKKVKISPERTMEAAPLGSGREYWKVLGITRIDISDRTQQVKYVLHDCGNTFNVLTNDPTVFLDAKGEFLGPQYPDMFEHSSKAIGAFTPLFELCTTAIYLAAYFDHFGDDVKEERHKTALAESLALASFRPIKKLIPPSQRIAYRKVSVLRTPASVFPGRSTYYVPPRFKMEMSGYWKRLGEGQVGADKHGNEIHGRTWVHKKLSWVQSDSPPAPIRASVVAEVVPHGADPGMIYVMRSAAHPRNMFKVGLTRRTGDARANDLSSETGSPDCFHVMQQWPVSDCAKAEKMIHERLEFCRINPRREFFEIPYKELFAIIAAVIDEIEVGTPE